MRLLRLSMCASLFLLLGAVVAWAAEPPAEVVGFSGTLTGEIKKADEAGRQVLLLVTEAKPGAKSKVKDGAALAGKEVSVTARWKTGHEVDPDSIAYLKTLKEGDKVSLEVFWEVAAKKLRLLKPPVAADAPADAPAN